MVERDRFEKQFGPGWLAAYRYVRESNASLEEVSDKLDNGIDQEAPRLGWRATVTPHGADSDQRQRDRATAGIHCA